MGIPRFGRWIQSYAKEALRSKLTGYNDSLFIDGNGVAHRARGNVFKEDIKDKDPLTYQANLDYLSSIPTLDLYFLIFNEITRLIDEIFNEFKPRRYFMFSLDGVAPLAKISQQGSRRYKSSLHPSPLFDRNMITPGTEFMVLLNIFLKNYFQSKIFSEVTIYSPHTCLGEGEHKIMDVIRSGVLDELKGNHIIYGLDADLILLASSVNVKNMIVCRESFTEYVNIGIFKKKLYDNGVDIHSFIIMMALIGNDFLHKPPSCTNMLVYIDKMIEIYKREKLKLHSYGNVNWNDMKILMYYMAVFEKASLYQVCQRLHFSKYTPRDLNRDDLLKSCYDPDMDVFFDNYRTAWYDNEMGSRGTNPRVSKLLSLFPVDVNRHVEEKLTAMCEQYVNGVSWYYLYYRRGTAAVNHDWYYAGYHVPLFFDLYTYLSNINPVWVYRAYEGMHPLSIPQQLVSVIPIMSINIIPEPLKALYTIDSPITDTYPVMFEVDMNGKHAEHEAIPYIPLVNKNRIVQAVGSIVFTPEEVEGWYPEDNIIYMVE